MNKKPIVNKAVCEIPIGNDYVEGSQGLRGANWYIRLLALVCFYLEKFPFRYDESYLIGCLLL